MYKKVALVLLCFAIGEKCFGGISSEIEQAQSNIISLIREGHYAQARTETEKMLSDYQGDSALADALNAIALRYEWADALQYEWVDKYSDAKAVYQQMKQNSLSGSHTRTAELGIARMTVLPLILSRKFDQAEKVFNEMAADFSDHADFAYTLYWVGERYKWAGKYEDAKDLYRWLIEDYPESPYADRARLGIPRADVWYLIRSYDFYNAKKALDKMAADFKDHADLPETLYGCAEKYRWSDNYEEEKALYQQIIREYPDSPYAKKAELELKRASIFSLIISQNYGEAKISLNKLKAELNESKDLPATLYAIAGRYRWSKNYDEEKDIYEQILEKYPDSSYASKSQLGIARTTVQSLIESQKFDEAQEAFDKLVADFSEHPDLEDTLYWIARCYGWSNRYEEERYVYQLIIENNPDSAYASKAKVGTSKAGVTSLIAAGSYSQADETTNKLIADFNDHPDLPSAIFAIGTGYYEQAIKYKGDGRNVEAKEYFRKAMAAWDRIITEFPTSAKYTPQAYYYTACCNRDEFGEYEKAIEYYKIMLEDWPDADYRRSSRAWLFIAFCYEKLGESGGISASANAERICHACRNVLENYPNADFYIIQGAQKLLRKYQTVEQ